MEDLPIFLSAQPDDYYFIWQLELQLINFKSLSIPPDKVHILVSYNSKRGVRDYFIEFADRYSHNACIYFYPDTRDKKKYLSSIRPNIIRQHFEQHPFLCSSEIFYHDSDIIFRKLPDFKLMKDNTQWYASDTGSYLNIEYISRYGGADLLSLMCKSVGIDYKVVIENNSEVNGAQYFIKNVSIDFWESLETDSETLFNVLRDYNFAKSDELYTLNESMRSGYQGISTWYADMWAFLWNAWKRGIAVKKHAELDFCWPYDSIERWENTNILHYSGFIDSEDKSLFRKGNYPHHSPYYDHTLALISEQTCSSPIKLLIGEALQIFNQSRHNLSDVTFIIPVFIDSESRLINLYTVVSYLSKYFNSNIILIESGAESRINVSFLNDSCHYIFHENPDPLFHRTHAINTAVKLCLTPIVGVFDCDVVLSIDQILESVSFIRSNQYDLVYPYDGEFINVDSLYKNMFSKILDIKLLIDNRDKFWTLTKRSYGGAFFISKKLYSKAGLENENFRSWGPEDLERKKRMLILGYRLKRIDGPIFHLIHDRKDNSKYTSNLKGVYFDEYFSICNMRKPELLSYISSWSWT
ncbi:hypothetical protein GCM10028806_09470 [Spirosoma terrae]|uniref:Galactosyltransferase C-terminal domain-containing protein n=1 Tax=Spirosoma terrae TaxID=1968276 RepID=A0A6L9L9T8_9BACT|nr:galactosyltransferase-related protein [Spirosoma terrae]NDU95911.1 hypothetical protein [Spirosoma terrae]